MSKIIFNAELEGLAPNPESNKNVIPFVKPIILISRINP